MELLDFLKSLHDRLLDLSRHITFDKKNQLHFVRISLYSTLIEFSGAIINLIENNGRVAVRSAFRSFLEAAVELRNLNKDPSYVEHMYASHMDQWLDVLKEAKKGNPHLASIRNELNLDQVIAKDEAELAALLRKNKQPLNVFQRFERAGMAEEYRSLYNFLSCDAHSNIRALVSRHFEETAGDFDVVMYKDEPIESFAATLDSAAAMLLEASLETHKAFQSNYVASVEGMLNELTDLRKKYVA